MKFCVNCGAMMEENVKFCPNCGSPVEQPEQPEQPAQPQPVYEQPYQSQATQPEDDKYHGFSMKWYKFLVYFALWISAASNAFSGVQTMLGMQYDGSANYVYRAFPAMRACDIICGILLLAVAALSVLAAVKLLKLAAVGPKLLIALYIANVVVSIFYIVFTLLATKGMLSLGDVLTPSVIASLAVSVAMTVVNWVYFKKRESIFIN